MKKLFIPLLTSIFLLACGEDEPVIIETEPSISLEGFSYGIGEITPTSVEIQFTSNSVRGSGGQLVREIWFKKPVEIEWSKVDITDAAAQQTYLLEGLEKATKYLLKPVFSIENLMKEGPERTFTTPPFTYFARRHGLHKALIYSPDDSEDIDFRELNPKPNFFIMHKGDSLEMEYTAISKDSMLLSLESNSSIFFDENDDSVERLDLPLHFNLNDYYNTNTLEQDLEIYNNQPRIDSLIIQQVRDCDGFERTQIVFRGLFWDPLNPPKSANSPDDYRVKISSVQNPSVSTPIMTISEFDANSNSFNQGCKDGFRTVIDIPVQNYFHRGSVLWVAFPKDLLPEGEYQLGFSIIKNDEIYTAEPFTFGLVYE